MEEKSPNSPPINLWLWEARAYHINGLGLWSELKKVGGTVTAACVAEVLFELENPVLLGSVLRPPAEGCPHREDSCWWSIPGEATVAEDCGGHWLFLSFWGSAASQMLCS